MTNTPTSPAHPHAPAAVDNGTYEPVDGVDGGQVVGPPHLPAVGTTHSGGRAA